MTIISISIDDVLLNELDTQIEKQGFSGRSDVVRQAIRNFLTSLHEVEKLSGSIEGVMTVIHKGNTDEFNKTLHTYTHIVKTQVHNHLQNHKCLELFVLEGKAKEIKDFKKDLEKIKSVEFVNLLVS